MKMEVNSEEQDGSGAQEIDSDSEEWASSEDDLDVLLEEALPDDFKKPAKIRKLMPFDKQKLQTLMEVQPKTAGETEPGMSADCETNGTEELHKFTEKVVTLLEEKVKISQDDLPVGWIQIRHSSGMPVFLHRKTRVCTMSKPYRLGPGSARKHAVPLNAVPCLAYRKAIEKESEEPITAIEQRDDLTSNSSLPDEVPVNGNSQSESVVYQDTVLMDCSDSIVLSSVNESELTSISTIEESASEVYVDLQVSENIVEEIKDDLEPGELSDSDEEANSELCVENNASNEKAQSSNKKSSVSSNREIEAKVNGTGLGFAKTPTTSIQQRLGLKLDGPTAGQTDPEGMKKLIPEAQLESSASASQSSIKPDELRQYCEGLFKFTEVKTKRFKTWSDRRKHLKEERRQHTQYPVVPEGMPSVIKFPIIGPNRENSSGKTSKDQQFYTLNFHGKSSVCILHEYVQHALRLQPSYKFGESRNSAAPYAATVMIDNMQYGTGTGTSKKLAKAAAASATLEILIPEMKDVLKTSNKSSNDMYHLGFFDQVELDDPRIPKMCASVSEKSPYSLLLACIQRNFGKRDANDIKFEVVSTGNQANRFRMQTGEYSVEVTASNKRDGKQLASQALLCKIHPHVKNFGSFLRLYGAGSVKSVKDKKQEEQEVTSLQTKASANSPNYAILGKLREKMLEIQSKRHSPCPKIQDNGESKKEEPPAVSVFNGESEAHASDVSA